MAWIDIAGVYNRVLTTNEIRDLRHLIKQPQSDASLIAYYQFNESDYTIFDKSKNHTIAAFTMEPARVKSRIPVGKGGVPKTLSSGV